MRNALNVRQIDMSSGPAFIVWSQQLDPADDQAVKSRLLVIMPYWGQILHFVMF